MRALLVGFAVTNEAVARQLLARGWEVDAVDDRPTDAARTAAKALGVALVEAPDHAALAALVERSDVMLPSPGVAPSHPAFALAAVAERPVWSELELAAQLMQESGSDVPIVAITGTNGKTTVTTLVTEMLAASGRSTAAVGNTDVPLVDVLDAGHDVIVVEASSFRLAGTTSFHPRVAVFLNLTPDHGDWHPTHDDYGAAKARIWARQEGDDVALVNIDDADVMRLARSAPARVMTFGSAGADYAVDTEGGVIRGPGGETLAEIASMARALPHDLANAAAALGAAREAGADPAACRRVVEEFRGLPHRVALVGEAGGVRWYDDSKATTPASVVTAVRGFDSVVLIAGGRNKGLDLAPLRDIAPRLRAVIGIGDAAADITAVFEGLVPVQVAASMDDAVRAAATAARPGDAVLLSPACASFDWYRNYAERGQDFERAVRDQLATAGTP